MIEFIPKITSRTDGDGPIVCPVDPAALETLIRGNGMDVPEEDHGLVHVRRMWVVVRSGGRIELCETD